MNTLVLRTQVSGGESFRELLEQVRETTLGAYEHQDVPFEKLVEELQPERSLSHQPLFQVLFTLQEVGDLKLSGLEWGWMDTDSDIAKFDLSFFISETDSGLYCWFEYDTDLFESRTIDRMLQHYVKVLEEITANPASAVNKLPLLTEEETRNCESGTKQQPSMGAINVFSKLWKCRRRSNLMQGRWYLARNRSVMRS